ncbi:MAG TPA: class I SAM-dependent methyltransferase [Kiritimatiellia bacterium]|nr:class I SAM-dependent methyltransferase [Kiritimatiellia bacterium]HRZ11405.1 class I SAM-dependent methyltransferase [Kiritimatiellia bacterium]HSA17044.1 class I SAM-dependent methyltransferase [Kiritimatiellia bacterium]
MNTNRRDFDKEAANWDENPARVRLAADVARAIARQVPLTPDMDILDFGCGTGLVALNFAPLVKSVTGADSSLAMIEVMEAKAREQGLNNVHTRHLLPGGSLAGAYDLIVSSMAFHHIEQPAALLRQLFAALKMPGRLCVADLDSDGGEFHHDNTGVFHFGFERNALGDWFRQAGFSKITATTAAEVTRPGRTGAVRTFSVFLVCGEKNAG